MDVLVERIQRQGMESPPVERDALCRWSKIFQAPTAEGMVLFDAPFMATPS
jgi:hypothetical protein